MLESGRPGPLAIPDCLFELARFSRDMLQPVNHAHFAVHRRRDNEVLLSLTGDCPRGDASCRVAVGNERTHAARLGEHQRLAKAAFNVLVAACRRDVTAEAKGVPFRSSSPSR